MNLSNLLTWTLTTGQTFTLPEGFLFASIYPATGASFTITNSLPGGIANVSLKTTGSIDTAFSIPTAPTIDGWKEHVITASGGTVLIVYATGL